MGEDRGNSGEVLFEFRQVGAMMRIAAIHSARCTEVVVIAPASATPLQMQNLALAKLRARLSGVEPQEEKAGPKAGFYA